VSLPDWEDFPADRDANWAKALEILKGKLRRRGGE
jgi:hypothetical protein